MQGLCEADAGTRTPGPFITSEERRFRMFAAGSLFACSGADLGWSGHTAFAAVSGCSIAHSLPTSAHIPDEACPGSCRQVVGAGLAMVCTPSATPVHDACERPCSVESDTPVRVAKGARLTRDGPEQPPARSTWRLFRSAQPGTGAGAATSSATEHAPTGPDRAAGLCWVAPRYREGNRTLRPAGRSAEVALREERGFRKNHHDPGVNNRGLRVLACHRWEARDKAGRLGRRRAA
jgi:hypothetical protein